jgi:hypothetical protein
MATIADHIVGCHDNGADDLSNLRTVYRRRDNRQMGNHLGERRGWNWRGGGSNSEGSQPSQPA